MFEIKVFTLYPDLYPGPLNTGIYKKAQEKKIWGLKVINMRDYANDKHSSVDGTPFGGGNGMLLRPDVVAAALDDNLKESENTIYLSPKGKKFDQSIAKKLSKEKNLNLLCGHFEGIDQRVLETRNIQEFSIGDFILSGGETASFVFIDSIVRLIPGVLGNYSSTKDESCFSKTISRRRNSLYDGSCLYATRQSNGGRSNGSCTNGNDGSGSFGASSRGTTWSHGW